MMGHTKAQLLSNECTSHFVEIKAIKLHVEPDAKMSYSWMSRSVGMI